nr:ribonuclease 8-like [Manis javanica]
MAAARAGLHPLLGTWVAKVLFRAKPSTMTSAQWSETQHMQSKPQGCNRVGNINKDPRCCKDLNTFLHESSPGVAKACQTPIIACKSGHENCHQSQGPVSLTTCELTSGRYPDCRYKEST